MFKAIIYAALVTLVCLVPAASAQTAPSWQKLVSADGKFEVSFPAEASRDVKHVKTASGDFAEFTTYKAEYRDGAFFVTYADFPYEIEDPAYALVQSQKGFLNGANATAVSASTATFMGYPARVFQARTEVQGEVIMFSVRAYVVDRRLYQVAVGRFESRISEPENARFLSSFRITARPEPGRRLVGE